jgi:UPF0716 protein FxsA
VGPLLVLLFIAIPIAELAVIIQIGEWLGLWPTLLLLLADAVLGSLLLRAQGRAAWRRFSGTLAAGRPPAREIVDGALILVGGALLLTPGFITDVVGLAFLVPPTRALIRRFVVARIGKRMVVSMTGRMTTRPTTRNYDVEGTAVDVDPSRRELP